MQGPGLRDQLATLAEEAGLRVRVIPAASAREGDVGPGSGTCRVRGEWWVMLAASDSLEDQASVLAGALRDHAAEFLESRFLAPALRERLEG